MSGTPHAELELADLTAKSLCDSGDISILRLTCRAPNKLNFALGNLLANIDPEGDPDQISVFELHSGALIAIVEENVVSGTFKLFCDLLSSGHQRRIADICGHNNHVKGSNGGHEEKSVFVIALFDGRGKDSLNANAITAHNR